MSQININQRDAFVSAIQSDQARTAAENAIRKGGEISNIDFTNPNKANLTDNKARLSDMLRLANNKSKSFECLDSNLLDKISREVPKPGFFEKIFTSSGKTRGNLFSAAKDCEKASKNFSSIKINDITVDKNGKLSGEALKKVENFIEAQNKFSDAICKFADMNGDMTPLFSQLHISSQSRISEAVTFVALAQSMKQDSSLADTNNVKAIDVMRTISGQMHLNVSHRDELSEKMDGFFKTVDNLHDEKKVLSHEEFLGKITSIKNEISEIRTKIEKLTNGEQGLVAEKAQFEPFLKMLGEAEARIDALGRGNYVENIQRSVRALLPKITEEMMSSIRNSNLDIDTSIIQYNQISDLAIKLAANLPVNANKLIKLINTARTKLLSIPRETVLVYSKEIKQIIAGVSWTSSEFKNAEYSQLAKMLSRVEARNHERREYLLNAFEHGVDIHNMMEASLRNLPLSSFNFKVSDNMQVSSKKLGAGGFNTVDIISYKDAMNVEKKLVFKPEAEALRGYFCMATSSLGMDASVTVSQLNIASSKVAQMIGADDVIAKSSMGVHDGKLGMLMEIAPGTTGKDMCKSSLAKQLIKLDPNMFATIKANLMRECSNLEWADILSAQTDRHHGNFLIDINFETSKVTLTGIDNDSSFGSAMIGIDKIDISKTKTILQDKDQIKNLLKNKTDQILDISKIDIGKNDNLLRSTCGVNQIYTPRYIDKNTYEKLMNIDENAYYKELKTILNKDLADSALLRLKSAKDKANELLNENKVISDWSSFNELREDIPSNFLRKGFYQQNFAKVFNVVEGKLPR